jgi:hypothetical protein
MTSDFLTFPDDPPRARRYTRCIDRMCGATDCPACHPSHFTGGIYIGDAHDDRAPYDSSSDDPLPRLEDEEGCV